MLSEALEVLSEAPDAMLTALALMWKLLVLEGSHRATPRRVPPSLRGAGRLCAQMAGLKFWSLSRIILKKGCGRGGD